MNNVCVYGEEIELSTEGQQPTFKDILVELNRLQLENECLKADKLELQKEVIQLRNDKNELHNRLNENSNDSSESENNEGGWTEEEFDIVVKGYAMVENNKKFV